MGLFHALSRWFLYLPTLFFLWEPEAQKSAYHRADQGENPHEGKGVWPKFLGEKADQGIVRIEQPGAAGKEEMMEADEHRVKIEHHSHQDQTDQAKRHPAAEWNGFPKLGQPPDAPSQDPGDQDEDCQGDQDLDHQLDKVFNIDHVA